MTAAPKGENNNENSQPRRRTWGDWEPALYQTGMLDWSRDDRRMLIEVISDLRRRRAEAGYDKERKAQQDKSLRRWLVIAGTVLTLLMVIASFLGVFFASHIAGVAHG